MADACDRGTILSRVRLRRWYTVGSRSCGAALSRSCLPSHARCLPPVHKDPERRQQLNSLSPQPALAHCRSPCRILPAPYHQDCERCLLRGFHPWSLPPFSSQAATVDHGSPALRSLGNATADKSGRRCGRPALKDGSNGLAKIAAIKTKSRRRQGHSPHRPRSGRGRRHGASGQGGDGGLGHP